VTFPYRHGPARPGHQPRLDSPSTDDLSPLRRGRPARMP
jgi:hypothetical protein